MNSPIALGPVFHIIGILLTVLGAGMVIPALADALAGDANWDAFVGAAAITLSVSGGMFLATRSTIERFTIRQTFLLTTLAWVVLAGFGAIPFMISRLNLDLADAVFESMSGLTTTGATVITGLDTAPPGILLWRALLHWYGGVGIIVMAIAILPVLGVGGMQLFRTESSERGNKPFASVRDTAYSIGLVYLLLTLFSMVLFILAGMPPFDALCHAMASVATGGFSTRDSSVGGFHSIPIMWAAIVSMIFAGISLTFYIRLWRNPGTTLFSDTQVWTLLGLLAVAWTAMTTWLSLGLDMPLWEAFSHGAFNTTSIMTSTGFASAPYDQWGSFAVILIFLLFFVGGCTGSTTGSIKIFRWQILVRAILIQLTRMQQPHRVVKPKYQGKPVDPEVIQSVINFVMVFVLCLMTLTLVLGAMGLNLTTSVSAAAAILTNLGPGIGPEIGPAGTFAPLPDTAKWLLCFGMLLGRLEIFTVLVLLTPMFWRN